MGTYTTCHCCPALVVPMLPKWHSQWNTTGNSSLGAPQLAHQARYASSQGCENFLQACQSGAKLGQSSRALNEQSSGGQNRHFSTGSSATVLASSSSYSQLLSQQSNVEFVNSNENLPASSLSRHHFRDSRGSEMLVASSQSQSNDSRQIKFGSKKNHTLEAGRLTAVEQLSSSSSNLSTRNCPPASTNFSFTDASSSSSSTAQLVDISLQTSASVAAPSLSSSTLHFQQGHNNSTLVSTISPTSFHQHHQRTTSGSSQLAATAATAAISASGGSASANGNDPQKLSQSAKHSLTTLSLSYSTLSTHFLLLLLPPSKPKLKPKPKPKPEPKSKPKTKTFILVVHHFCSKTLDQSLHLCAKTGGNFPLPLHDEGSFSLFLNYLTAPPAD